MKYYTARWDSDWTVTFGNLDDSLNWRSVWIYCHFSMKVSGLFFSQRLWQQTNTILLQDAGEEIELVSSCFEPSQPQRTASGLMPKREQAKQQSVQCVSLKETPKWKDTAGPINRNGTENTLTAVFQSVTVNESSTRGSYLVLERRRNSEHNNEDQSFLQ